MYKRQGLKGIIKKMAKRIIKIYVSLTHKTLESLTKEYIDVVYTASETEKAYAFADCLLYTSFLDIYPLDKIPDDEKLFRKQARKAFIYSKLLILRSCLLYTSHIQTGNFVWWMTALLWRVCAMYCIHMRK